jgi:UDP-N-acetylmuramyl-tripeptide synthetase
MQRVAGERRASGGGRQAFDPDPDIASIHYRSQAVQAGGMFVAIEGQTADGHDFIAEALQRGAAAIVAQKAWKDLIREGTPSATTENAPVYIQVADTRKALADLAARFYGNPSEQLVLIGITGTNGKTTVTYLVEGILVTAGFKTGVIGTINYRYAGKTFNNPMTTPEALDLQRILAEMQRAGTTHVVMEASSHAIELQRIRNCWFDVAAFANLSQDHLDFHGDMQSYWASKKRLFTEYLNRGPKKQTAVAVINCDDEKGSELLQELTRPVIKTGTAPAADIIAETSRCNFSGTVGRVSTPGGSFDFKTPLVGTHNIANILSATGVGFALRIPAAVIKAGLESATAIPGRLEGIQNRIGRFVFVDYAHTPDALENVLSALQSIAPARIICVFGCGGDRDKKKRLLMGEIAARGCDLTVVTSDNPRTEDPLAIIQQILPGTRRMQGREYSPAKITSGFEKRGYVVEPDRRRAIEIGIRVALPGDVVLIAGKGHETYQIIGKQRIPFDDREEAHKALLAVASEDLNNSQRIAGEGQ